jgi:replicative DNA helicase
MRLRQPRLEKRVKSELYSQSSIQALLDRLDGPTFLQQAGLSNGDFVAGEKQIKSYCPICQDRSKMTLVIDADTRRGHCINLSCQGSNLNTEEGNLIELFALAKSLSTDAAVQQLGQSLGLSLTRKETPGLVGETAGRHFEYVEVVHLAPGEDGEMKPASIHFAGRDSIDGRGILIPEAQVEEFVAKYRSDVFRSHFIYNTDSKDEIDSAAEQGKLFLLGDFYVVFNATSSAEIVHAINQAIDLVERLKQGYTVPYEAVYIYYTNRNIEVHVDRYVFGVEATLNLHEIYRRMACAVVGVDPLKPQKSTAFSQIDLSAYRHDFLTAVPGTVVTANGRETYKIRMSYAAFKKMSYQRLHEFSLRRPELMPREPWTAPSEDAVGFFSTVMMSIESDTRLDERDTIASLFYRTAESAQEISTLKQLAPTLLRRLFDENRQLVLTPSPHLDRALSGGLYPGHLYVVAGNPGSGTSTLVLQFVNYAAANQKAQCVLVGLQRGVEEIFKRSLSYLGKIPVWEIDEKRQSPSELYEDKDFSRRLFAAFERYQQFADHITILEGAAAGNLNRLVQILRDKKDELRQKSARGGGVLLVIDSLQLMVAMIRAMRPERGGEMVLTEEGLAWSVETLTSRLKALARELDVTVLATLEHQLAHRSITTDRSDADPAMRQLFFDTQFADTVMLLSRQGSSLLNLRDYFKTHYTDTPQESRIESISSRLLEVEKAYKQTQEFQALRSEFAVLDIIKNRNGPRDKILFISHKPVSFFEPLEYQQDNGYPSTSPLASAAT